MHTVDEQGQHVPFKPGHGVMPAAAVPVYNEGSRRAKAQLAFVAQAVVWLAENVAGNILRHAAQSRTQLICVVDGIRHDCAPARTAAQASDP
jgi:hypothetical protein